MKVVNRLTIYFYTFWLLNYHIFDICQWISMNNIHWNSLTNVKDMVILLLADQVFKWHHSLLTGFSSHCNSQFYMCLYDSQFQICSLVVWLLYCSESLLFVIQNVPLVDSIHPSWFINYLISHITKLQIWIWRTQHTPSIDCCSECKSRGLGVIFKTWSTNIEMTVSLAFVNGFQ